MKSPDRKGHPPGPDRGFILIVVLFIMLFLAVTALALNSRGAMQARMASDQSASQRTSLAQMAAIEEALWQLTKDPFWWNNPASKDFVYDGQTFTRVAQKSAVSGYTDAIVLGVTAPGGARSMRADFRYYVYPLIEGVTIGYAVYQATQDSAGNIYFAVPDAYRVYKLSTTGEITVAAGDGTNGSSGDGGPALSAKLDRPYGVYCDATGNLYIADSWNNRIRKVDGITKVITTIAGTGGSSFSGDGFAATSATMKKPRSVFVDASGNVYIADTDNHCIRKVASASGLISTVAGTGGTHGFSGDGGAATSATLYSPRGVFVDASGDIYIADTDNHCIRKVTAASGNIVTVAGQGTLEGRSGDGGLATAAKMDEPRSVWVSGGILYIADTENNEIRKVESGVITRFAGNAAGVAGYSGDGGLATGARLNMPSGIFIDASGNLVISDSSNNVLRRVVTASGVISSLFASSATSFDTPQKAFVSAGGVLYVADTAHNLIRRIDTAGISTNAAGNGNDGYSGDGGLYYDASLNQPQAVFVDASGSIYIADAANHCIRKVDAATGIISTIAGVGTSGGFAGDGGLATTAKLNYPGGVFVRTNGDIYIADTSNHCIRKVDAATGIISTVAGVGTLFGFAGDGGGAASARLNYPQDLFIKTNGDIYIADTSNHCIRKVDGTTGIISTVAGIGTSFGSSGDGGLATAAKLNLPYGIHVDASGNLFIADTWNHKIRAVSAYDFKIRTLAGTGALGYNGNYLAAVNTNLNLPGDVCMADMRGGGDIYVVDTYNNRMRRLHFKRVRELY